jgi:ribonuclease HI
MVEARPVVIYTDGACIGNPGPGGYGAVLLSSGQRKELSGGFRRTTNNRMELLAAVTALEALKEPCTVTLYSDSQYLVDNYTNGYVQGWRKRGWKRSNKEPALNSDLWERFLQQCQRHRVRLEWVKGHAGNRENERCDALSNAAALGKNLPADEIYEQTQGRPPENRLF